MSRWLVVGGSVDDLSVGRWLVCRWFCNTPWFTILHMLIEILLPTTYLLLMNTSSGKSCKFSISSTSISSSSSSTITIFFAKGCFFHWKHDFLSRKLNICQRSLLDLILLLLYYLCQKTCNKSISNCQNLTVSWLVTLYLCLIVIGWRITNWMLMPINHYFKQ